MISITSEGMDRVQPWAEELGAEFPIFCQANSGEYSTGGVPTAYLLGPDAKVLWHGHPKDIKDEDLEGYLDDVAKQDRKSTWGFLVSKSLGVTIARL